METSSNFRQRERTRRFIEYQELHDTNRCQRARERASQVNGHSDPRLAAKEEARQKAILEKKKALSSNARRGHVPAFPEQQLKEEVEYLENLRQTKY